MELKSYQQEVITDLNQYLDTVIQVGTYDKAFNEFWQDRAGKYDPINNKGMPPYKNTIANAPHVCIKVPTAGGKTFIAINALEAIFQHYHASQTKTVVWLVPWSNLLEQTYKNLNDPEHPYRKKLNQLFNHRVAVYLKEDGLQGANLSPASVRENLTIFVMSFASLRARNKDDRKVYQENGYLQKFQNSFDESHNLPDVDETALINVIRKLKPVLVVDESHNAESDLSVEMLQNLNPSFILDLTATPKQNSNIVSFVPAYRLKAENMVKLPVIVFNSDSKDDVINNALHLQKHLELQAIEEEKQTGKYIRPIVLFQAQPINATDSVTFERIKQDLIKAKIHEEQIKIKTANINELKNVDLMSRDCRVRYIITVNALKEGWDCPFAYILASLANKSSVVDVEQILGRVLRQPYVTKHINDNLNVSYVLTASQSFHETLEKIVEGLQACGFSKNDYRAQSQVTLNIENDNQAESDDTFQLGQASLFDTHSTSHDENNDESSENESINVENINFEPLIFDENNQVNENISNYTPSSTILSITQNAKAESSTFEANLKSNIDNQNPNSLTAHLEDVGVKVNKTSIVQEYENIAQNLALPNFFLMNDDEGFNDFFADESDLILNKNDLLKGFDLSKQSVDFNFDKASQEIYQVDVQENKGDTLPAYGRISNAAISQKYIDAILATSNESQIREITNQIMQKIGDMYPITDPHIKAYVGRIVDTLNESERRELLKNPNGYTKVIREKINELSKNFAKRNFNDMIKTNQIILKSHWKFHPELPLTSEMGASINKRLYTDEAKMNSLETEIMLKIADMDNILFWHRNLERKKDFSGFCINGFINHYPDFIIYTKKGNIILLETKGDDRDNTDTRDKIELGRQWETLAGKGYAYFMIFKTTTLEGSYTLDRAIELIKHL